MSARLWGRLFAAPKELPALNPPSRLGLRALEVAWSEVGRGEEGGNNRGPDIVRYRLGRDTGGPWCAWFVSYCFVVAARQLGLDLPFEPTGHARTLFDRIGRAGWFVDEPLPGDVYLFARGAAGSRKGHVGIVARVGYGMYLGIEGNKGLFPSRVRDYPHEFGEPGFLGFARAPYL